MKLTRKMLQEIVDYMSKQLEDNKRGAPNRKPVEVIMVKVLREMADIVERNVNE